MSQTGYTLYVLRLERDKWYVGKTRDFARRLSEHLLHEGSAWTRLYLPIDVESTQPMTSSFDEDKLTLELMAKHGIDNVRGGSFAAIKLGSHDLRVINKMLRSTEDTCLGCGAADHWVANCPQRQTVGPNGSEMLNADTDDDSDSSVEEVHVRPPVECGRCGRTGHSADGCYAKTTYDGRFLGKAPITQNKKPACERCGRNNHTTEKCFSKTHYDGSILEPKPGRLVRMPTPNPRHPDHDLVKMTCERCGRNTHEAGKCFAKVHYDGRTLEESEPVVVSPRETTPIAQERRITPPPPKTRPVAPIRVPSPEDLTGDLRSSDSPGSVDSPKAKVSPIRKLSSPRVLSPRKESSMCAIM